MVAAVSRLSMMFAVALASACAQPTPAPDHPSAPSARPSICDAQVARVWHGRTVNAKADEYDAYLKQGIAKFPTIAGNLGYQMMRETIGDETHFTVISYWASRDAIHAYAGADISRVHALPRDAELLIDPEPTVKNYDLAVQTIGCSR
jgi:heme-degrading monooxygenase HmoA